MSASVADRIIEALFGEETTLEDVAEKTSFSADELRECLRPENREDYMALFETALRLKVSPLWLMGADAPKQQTEDDQKLRRILFATEGVISKPGLIDVLSRLKKKE